jgi:hypothetical protein
MSRSVSSAWLADLIKAAEVLGASGEPCDPAIVRAFSHRLETPGQAAAVRSALPCVAVKYGAIGQDFPALGRNSWTAARAVAPLLLQH